jgi:hypothetical protein
MVRGYVVVIFSVIVGIGVIGVSQSPAPRIWDDEALKDWATPIAGLGIRPAHYSSAEYYSSPEDNLRTYPVYRPDKEPPGYWEELQKKKPEPLVDASKVQTKADWITAGERAFEELDNFWTRTNDPAVIARARDARSFEGVATLPDGTVRAPRWVVTPEGVMLSFPDCITCHRSLLPAQNSPGSRIPQGLGGPVFFLRGFQRLFKGDSLQQMFWRMFTVPWAPDERIEGLRKAGSQTMPQQMLRDSFGGGGQQAAASRIHGSPFFPTRFPDLTTLRYSHYLDATGTHRLRGPEDIARYAAFISGADPMDFGTYRILTDQQRRMEFHHADEVLYAIGSYLWSLEPPKNPETAPKAIVGQGEQIFHREQCVNCHVPPNYTNGMLTPAEGYQPPADHPDRAGIMPISVGTDPGLALKTRKGTGFYKIPSLRGVWRRQRLLHDGSVASLEEMFDPDRLNPDHEPGGGKPPGVTKHAIPGHRFGLNLSSGEKEALLAFLRSL